MHPILLAGKLDLPELTMTHTRTSKPQTHSETDALQTLSGLSLSSPTPCSSGKLKLEHLPGRAGDGTPEHRELFKGTI